MSPADRAGDNPVRQRGKMNQAKKTLAVTSVQQKAQSELATPEKAAVALTDLSMEYAALQAKATRTPEEDARLKTLEAKIEPGNEEVSDFFRRTLYPELALKTGAQDANALLSKETSEVSRLQKSLAELGSSVRGPAVSRALEAVVAFKASRSQRPQRMKRGILIRFTGRHSFLSETSSNLLRKLECHAKQCALD